MKHTMISGWLGLVLAFGLSSATARADAASRDQDENAARATAHQTTRDPCRFLPVTCVPRCIGRNAVTGACYNYAADFCGRGASCAINCIGRNAVTGECYNYGADICSACR